MSRSLKKEYRSLISSNEEQLKAPKLQVIHPMNVAYAGALDYRTFRSHSHSFRCNGNVAERTVKLAKCMGKIVKPYKFDSSSASILSSLEQFKRACDSNGVLEGVAVLLLSYFMAMAPAALSIIRLTPRKNEDDLTKVRGEIEGQEHTYMYVEAVSYLLVSYATDDKIAKVAYGNREVQ